MEVTRLTSERPFNPARLCSTWRLTAWAVTPWREGRAVVSTRAGQAGTDGDAVLQVRVRHAAPRHRQVQGGPDGELLPQRDLQVPVPGMCAAGWAREAAGSAWRRRRLSPRPACSYRAPLCAGRCAGSGPRGVGRGSRDPSVAGTSSTDVQAQGARGGDSRWGPVMALWPRWLL